MAYENDDLKQHAHFEKAEEFLGYLKTGEYQEQAYLLDPWLERIIGPPIEAIRRHASEVVASGKQYTPAMNMSSLATIIYQIIKTRGYKTIVSFFPHQILDLNDALSYMKLLESHGQWGSWAIRYVVLLWLSLICRLPFDLSSFDDPGAQCGQTAQIIESIGKMYLEKAGLERDAAALLLARLYTRQDTCVLLGSFLEWCTPRITEQVDLFQAVGCLQVMSEILKSGGLEQIQRHLDRILELAQSAPQNKSLATHTVIRKFAIKASSRVGLRLLPAATTLIPLLAKTLHGEVVNLNEGLAQVSEADVDLPPQIEGIIDDILNALHDRDTTIRWSAAKYIGRIAARVPTFFTDQLLDALMDLYQVHYVEGEDLVVGAEPTWHGATLACAEFARQGLINVLKLPIAIQWTLKALFFDVRKGAHSIGSNVRDAACYFLWSLARTQDSKTIEPHAVSLARALLTVALFDREVHIRRAASAAFQENVGRMGLFPHGIDVLKWTDFYGVGVRRNAFLVSAPEVAKYLVYREGFLRHLTQTTLKHWDPTMRSIGSQAIKELCTSELDTLAPPIVHELSGSLIFADSHEIHGALLGLRELAEGYKARADDERSTKARVQIFELVDKLTDATINGYGNDLLLEGACMLIASSVSPEGLKSRPDVASSAPPRWKIILDISLRHRNDVVQEAGAKQGMTRVLGYAGSSKYPEGVKNSINCLLQVVKRDVTKKTPSSYCVEARRNAYESLSRLLKSLDSILFTDLSINLFQSIILAFLDGLEDYTVDERGDVGSWVRIACIKGIGDIILILLEYKPSNPWGWLPLDDYIQLWAGLLKQGAERLDNVRADVGKQIVRLVNAIDVAVSGNKGDARWMPEGFDLMKRLFVTDVEAGDGWNEASWLFPRIVQILPIERYRTPLIRGIVLSIGSRNENTHRPATDALTQFLIERQEKRPEEQIIVQILGNLVDLASKNFTSNNIVLPILSTLDVLIEGGLAREASGTAEGIKVLERLLDFAGKRVEKLKNVQRINTSMRIVVQLLAVSEVFEIARSCIRFFLTHVYPKVREESGEYLYMVIQSQDVPGGDAAEPILLETDWAGTDFASRADKVVAALE
ncbi:Tubulin-specific chaperone D AltName: Full=Beta-tubulin cofactor D; Short=tfcD; AltName: Full=SSD-1; AltName: Full=Tubulin-folding cofactor D [Serendipita indica DSM 11827]|nr:Tubulin-specific chaperone D AltName: Full=Beta-tubulin cofactor D; Short=tfcD; AltName: Full=SSD-1; AltName: Full=Tubulin-folding cofactor D [Serendipita indica DSM 11827]